jgi:hypothetical protein
MLFIIDCLDKTIRMWESFIIKKKFNYYFRPQLMTFVVKWSSIIQLCQFDHQPFIIVSFWSLSLSDR